MKRPVLTAMVFFLLGACAALRDFHANTPDYGSDMPPYERIQFAGENATEAERVRCEAVGGAIERHGLLGWESCVQRYPDAGKACKDSGDCLGKCKLDLSKPHDGPGEPAQGACQITDSVFGCYATVEDGLEQQTICFD
ncbi:MAG: hypothetical protein KDA53_17830 [Hyphomonas sp.]|nr:hypothetical protein [Hyphomonas sp.]